MRAVVYGDRIDLADELQEEFKVTATVAVTDAAKLLLEESRRQITRFGKIAPAPPGETPATVTGNLLRLTKLRHPKARIRGRTVMSGVQYAPHSFLLEFGHVGPDGKRVLPRPFVRVAVANSEGPIDQLIRERFP